MLWTLGVTAAWAQYVPNPCAGAASQEECDSWYAHRAQPQGPRVIVVQAPATPRPVVQQGPYQEPVEDCAISADDVAVVRDRIAELRRIEGASIGVAAVGPRCQQGLDLALRTGPFLGVYRSQAPISHDAPCVAVLKPGVSGWELDPAGQCRGAVKMDGEIASTGASRVTSVGWWLPYGGTVRVQQDLGEGWSALVDVAWHPPKLWDVEYDRRYLGPDSDFTSSFRWLFGVDVGAGSLDGGYLGARAGFEAATPAGGMRPNEGIVQAVLGQRWIGPDRGVIQLGGGVQAALPIGARDEGPVVITPQVELRLGTASKR
ncbi:MAG: hypothetical protein ABMA64_24660 [Myxococcota bacterium]